MKNNELLQDVSEELDSLEKLQNRRKQDLDSASGGDASLGEEKIEELHTSLGRLRGFVSSLEEEQIGQIPVCVWDYCGSSLRRRVRTRAEVIQLAQHRVNKQLIFKKRMLRNKKIKKNWNSEDITLLVWLVSKQIERQGLSHFSQLSKNDWQNIASMISGSNCQTCKFRWLSLKKFKLVTHKWSKLESKLLTDVISQMGSLHWKLIAEKLYERNANPHKVFRTAKQCREHWNCFLNPKIQKGPWSVQQDRRLLEYVLQLEGSKKWSEIAKYMQGRTENALKNRFNLLIKRQREDSGNLTEKRIIKLCLNRLMFQEGQQERMIESALVQPLEMSEASQVEEQRVEQVSPEEVRTNRRSPIVPQVRENIQIPMTEMNFNHPFNGFYGFMGGMNPSMMQINSDPSNGVFFTYLFPRNLL